MVFAPEDSLAHESIRFVRAEGRSQYREHIFIFLLLGEFARRFQLVQACGGAGEARTVLPLSRTALDEAYHYTAQANIKSIMEAGLFKGAYATPDGKLSALQAKLDIELHPRRASADEKVRIDLKVMREAGTKIAGRRPGGPHE